MYQTKLISALRRYQAKGALTAEVFQEIAAAYSIPVSQVAGAASFYSEFAGYDDGPLEYPGFRGGAGPIMSDTGAFEAYEKARSDPNSVIELIRNAKLCGRGGSGFPVASKWDITKSAVAKEKYVICNCSEGECDTYKDLALMICAPNNIIAGAMICALAVGAEKVFLYVRSEYKNAAGSLSAAVAAAYSTGVLGNGVDMEVFLGGGAYVCGEETALCRCIEGFRGEPSIKPPYTGTCGLFGKPTVINNAESFAAIPGILLNGVCETKLYTVTGAVRRPGVYEMPYGCAVRQLAELAGAYDVKGFQVGGGATGMIAATDGLEVELSLEGCKAAGLSLGTGSVHFFNREESIVSAVLKSVRFLENQSCGKCVPCKYGIPQIADLLCLIESGQTNPEMLNAVQSDCLYLKNNARCPLGQSVHAFVCSAIKAFPEEFEAERRA